MPLPCTMPEIKTAKSDKILPVLIYRIFLQQ